MKEYTVILIKPDAVEERLIGKIIDRFEREDFYIEYLEFMHWQRPLVEQFYAVHKGKDFFDRNNAFIISGPLMFMVLSAEDAISRARALIGSTFNPEPGTIRAEFGIHNERTLVHASDSQEAAKYEMDCVWN